MSGSVDEEVVRMRFDNNAFERGVSASLSTLQKLKQALSFSGQGKGLDQIEAKANKFDMSGANKQIDESASHWSAWRTAGLIAFATVVHRAVNAGINVVKAFTIEPIAEGFKSYETQIDAAKTIMSNTGAKLPVIEQQLSQLQTYANQTVYSFADMSSAIGTFTAAGVKLKPAVQAIKGLGNSAALSGVSTQRLSGAYVQVSQALSTGVFRLQDWNSLSQAGLGGQNIQKALEATAGSIKGSGPKMDAAIKKYGNFRNSLTSGWLTGDIFNKTMGVMAGKIDTATGKTVAYSVAELKAKGYTTKHAIELNKLSTAAIQSATQIRTYTQLTSALKEEVGTAYGVIFKTIFGNLNGATKLFTALHNVAENALTAPLYRLNALLVATTKLGARSKAIDAFKNVFKALGAVIKPIKEAFRDFFPKETAQGLANLITKFDNFSKKLIIGGATADKLHRIFDGLFAIFYIGKRVVEDLFGVFTRLVGGLSGGAHGFLDVAASVGDFFNNLAIALDTTGDLDSVFSSLGNFLAVPLALFRTLGEAISKVFSGFHPKSAEQMASSLGGVSNVLAKINQVSQHVGSYFSSLPEKIKPGIDAVANAFHSIGQAISKGLSSASFHNVLATVQTGLLGGLVLMFKKFFRSGFNVNIGGGVLDKAGEALEGLTGTLKTMQLQLKAKILKEIAISVGILAASAVALSLVNPKNLGSAMQALAVGFGELLGSVSILIKLSGSAGFVKLPVVAASMNLLATAVLVLAGAVAIFAHLSWQQLEKGLTAVGILLAALVVTSYALSANSKGLIAAGIGMEAMAVAMNLLFLAVKEFSTMSWGEMLKGLAGVGIALGGIAIAMRLMPRGMLGQAAALLAIAVALQGLYLAVKEFSGIDYGTMLHGLAGIAGSLTAIAIGMRLMPKGMLLQSVALLAVAGALLVLSKALSSMGSMSWSEIGKGLTVLAGSMIILAGALQVMTGTLLGAAALVVVAGALRLLLPTIQSFAAMSWSAILKGFAGLAIAFGVIGVASALLAPVIPEMLALGAALALVGVAMLAFGGGAALLGVGLTAIAASGGVAIGIIINALKSLITLLPTLSTNLALALVNFITVIGKNAPAIIGAFVSLLNQLLQAIPKIMPSMIVAIGSLIGALLTVIVQNLPRIIAAGISMLMALLTGIRDSIGRIVGVVASIIVNFLEALAHNLGRIISAGVDLLEQFLIGIARAIGRVPGIVLRVVQAFLGALFGQLGRIVASGSKMVASLISGIASWAGHMISKGAEIVGHFIGGLVSGAGKLVSKGVDFVKNIISGIGSMFSNIYHSAVNLVGHLVSGIVDGLKHLVGRVIDGVKHVGSDILHGLGSALGIGGPSKYTQDMAETGIAGGLIKGLKNAQSDANAAAVQFGKSHVTAMRKSISGLGAMIASSDLDASPKITPVLDLTQVNKDAGKIGDLVSANPVNAKLSLDQASAISNAAKANAENAATVTPAPTNVDNSVSLTQYNTSPKALDAATLYRLTNNQLAQARQARGIPSSTP